MRYTGIQPQYFPRLHYFARVLNTDIFVLRDEVQFVSKHKYPDGSKGFSYQADSPIKQSTGSYILHVPISHNGLQPINNTKIVYSEKWVFRHLSTIKNNYNKAPNFSTYYPQLTALLNKKYTNIAELDVATFLWGLLVLLDKTLITTDMLTLPFVQKKLKNQKKFRLKKIVLGSDVNAFTNNNLDKNTRIVEAIKEFGANEDYCGETAFVAYMDKKLFEKNGIKVTVQNWKCDEYPQLYEKHGFIPNLSIIDLLMNVSREKAIEILSSKE